ncbi:hypothetical protein Fmac_026964 [Flemingia macrophylla]|uniref:Uncharacterized protein n=1 Tax=Flemingia macrophylla TaxID=520843 RepID=A0ABD1LGB4_9FABA
MSRVFHTQSEVLTRHVGEAEDELYKHHNPPLGFASEDVINIAEIGGMSLSGRIYTLKTLQADASKEKNMVEEKEEELEEKVDEFLKSGKQPPLSYSKYLYGLIHLQRAFNAQTDISILKELKKTGKATSSIDRDAQSQGKKELWSLELLGEAIDPHPTLSIGIADKIGIELSLVHVNRRNAANFRSSANETKDSRVSVDVNVGVRHSVVEMAVKFVGQWLPPPLSCENNSPLPPRRRRRPTLNTPPTHHENGAPSTPPRQRRSMEDTLPTRNKNGATLR